MYNQSEGTNLFLGRFRPGQEGVLLELEALQLLLEGLDHLLQGVILLRGGLGMLLQLIISLIHLLHEIL